MSPFEYIMVPVSIVLALALGKVLVAILTSIESGKQDWLHLLWCAVILLNVLAQWPSLWRLHANEVWSAAEYFLVMSNPLLTYSAAHTLVSNQPEDIEDWAAHMLRTIRPLLVLLLLTLPLWVLRNYLLIGSFPIPWLFVPLTVFSVAAFVRPNRPVMAACALVWLMPVVGALQNIEFVQR